MLVMPVVLGGKGRIALWRDGANVVDCGGVEATLGGVNDEGRFLAEGVHSTEVVCTVRCRTLRTLRNSTGYGELFRLVGPIGERGRIFLLVGWWGILG